MPVYQNKQTKRWKYRVYANDIFGNRKQFEKGGFATKREAQFAERELLSQDRVGECNLTFEELWELYKEHISLKMKAQSYRKTLSKFKNHILPYFKDYKVKNINATIYTKWQRIIEEKGFKYKYNASIHGSMVTILNYAVQFHGLKNNIASQVGNFKRKYDLQTSVNFWTLEEFNTFINVMPNDVYKAFFTTLYYTGLRQGECLALTWKDFNKDYLDIYKTISKEKLNGEYIVNTPKTQKSIRRIKLDDNLIQVLNELKEKAKQFEGFEEDWYIFGCINPLSPSTIGRKRDKYCAISGIKKIKIHELRHSHASLLLSYGVPITVISQRLGHSNITMTLDTYSHLIPQDEDKAINILNKINTLKFTE